MQTYAASVFSEISVHTVLLLLRPEKQGCHKAQALRDASELPGHGGSRPNTGGGSQPTVGGGITGGGGLPLECVLLQHLANPPRESLGDRDRPSMCQGPQLACLPSQFLTPHSRSSLMPKTDREITELSRARPPPLWRGPHGAS